MTGHTDKVRRGCRAAPARLASLRELTCQRVRSRAPRPDPSAPARWYPQRSPQGTRSARAAALTTARSRRARAACPGLSKQRALRGRGSRMRRARPACCDETGFAAPTGVGPEPGLLHKKHRLPQQLQLGRDGAGFGPPLQARPVRARSARDSSRALVLAHVHKTSSLHRHPTARVRSGHFDGGVRFWDLRKGDIAHEVASLHPQSQVTAVVASSGGSQILTNGRDNTLRLLDVRTFGILRVYKAGAAPWGGGGAGDVSLRRERATRERARTDFPPSPLPRPF